MSTSGAVLEFSLAAACVISIPVRCDVDREHPSGLQDTREAWPEHLLGRKLQSDTESFVLYGTDEDIAQDLRQWLKEELAAFRSRYDYKPAGKGLVLAIEPGPEPVLAIEEWRNRNVDRSRVIFWTSPIRNQSFHSDAGRPYSASDDAYFRESFMMPFDELARIAKMHTNVAKPAWVCFLATEAHMLVACEDDFRKRKQAYEKELQEVPALVKALSAGAMIMMEPLTEYFVAEERSTDLRLMALQRRETLWRAILQQTCKDQPNISDKLARLQDEIDALWKDIWVRRAID